MFLDFLVLMILKIREYLEQLFSYFLLDKRNVNVNLKFLKWVFFKMNQLFDFFFRFIIIFGLGFIIISLRFVGLD